MLISTLEKLLNRGLPRSPRAQQLCAELAGRKLHIEVQGFGRLLLESDGLTLHLSGNADPAPVPTSAAAAPTASPADSDAILRGGPFSLLSLAVADQQAALRSGSVQMGGDSETAGKFHELLRLLRPDPEEELALVLGDVPAHHICRLVRASLTWGERAASTTLENVAEYLAHERNDLVSAAEAQGFLAAVDSVREHVDRLAARIDLMTSSRS
jgi:ubiquinone biosynthesis accessory factor UbiJ